MNENEQYKVNWPGVIILGFITILVFSAGLLLGLLLNDSSMVTELQAAGQIIFGIGLGMGIATLAFREVLKGVPSDDR